MTLSAVALLVVALAGKVAKCTSGPDLPDQCNQVCVIEGGNPCLGNGTNGVPDGQTWWPLGGEWTEDAYVCCRVHWDDPRDTTCQACCPTDPKCTKILISDYQIAGDWSIDAGSQKRSVDTQVVDNCRGSSPENMDNMKSNEVTTTESNTWTRDSSWSNTFTGSVEVSDTLEVSASETLLFETASVKDSATIKATATDEVKESGDSSQSQTKTTTTSQASKVDISFTINPYSQVSFEWTTLQYTYSANYKATAKCVNANGDTVSQKDIQGRVTAQPESEVTIERTDTPCQGNVFCVPDQKAIGQISQTGITAPMTKLICDQTQLCGDGSSVPSSCRDNGIQQATYVMSEWYTKCIQQHAGDFQNVCECNFPFSFNGQNVNIAMLANGAPGVGCIYKAPSGDVDPVKGDDPKEDDVPCDHHKSGAGRVGGAAAAAAALVLVAGLA